MTKKAKTTDPKPVVTVDDHWRMWINAEYAGVVGFDFDQHDQEHPFVNAYAFVWFPADLRAVADFLDQLEGADLLSQVTE